MSFCHDVLYPFSGVDWDYAIFLYFLEMNIIVEKDACVFKACMNDTYKHGVLLPQINLGFCFCGFKRITIG